MADGIRDRYAALGVEGFYSTQGDQYANPHFPQVRALLMRNQERLDYSRALDFCCGSGEVSQVLNELGFTGTVASDPYTGQAYQAQTGKPCFPWSFEDIARGKWEGSYSCIICSFALHLCPAELLYAVSQQLLNAGKTLVVITPHKRPDLRRFEGFERLLSDFVLTEKGKKVRLWAFGRTY